ncbi:hypothetical protein VTL71DRAFT_4686 [Oculimacula yallundae]|uniref:Peptidase C14 caspase domain-containing protein n=1 Tax=Oculimacula yallundae TaxID=86028 RepID=A0ABR4C2Q5_9HELO
MSNSSSDAQGSLPTALLPIEPESSRTNNYQDEAASTDSRLKAIFDGQMGPSTSPAVFYNNAAVLLLSWHEDVDELKTSNEVSALEGVFRDLFHYQTQRSTITQDPRNPAQVQVNLILSKFVSDHGDPDTLLIVYYAGHGKPGESDKGLNLACKQSLNPDVNNKLHEIVWDSAEHIIRATLSDVLVIFDCCHAGQLEKNTRSGYRRRAFEFLAATSAKSTTRKPGPNSFTTALIWALKALSEGENKSFSTQELLTNILNAPNFPVDQSPRLSEREPPCLRRIVLAPWSAEVTTPESIIKVPYDKGDKKNYLSLCFVFNEPITQALVENLARDLRRLMGSADFNASTILWEGMNTSGLPSFEGSAAAFFAHKWLRNTIKRPRPPVQLIQHHI